MSLIHKIINFWLRLLYWLKVGKIEQFPFGETLLKENFANLTRWHVVSEGNWGAVYPNSLTCSTPRNVKLVEEGVRLYTKQEPEGIVGCDFWGNKQRRYYSSAEIYYLDYLNYGWFVADIEFDNSGIGCWDAFWVNSPGESSQHLEVDFFENKHHMEVTTHNHKLRKQFKFIYPKLKGSHRVIGHLVPGRATIYLDGYKIFTTRVHMPDECGPLILRFSTGLSEAAKDLPYYFTIKRVNYYAN